MVTFRKTWNGDSVASALGMYLFLKKIGKEVEIAAEKFEQSSVYSFLPGHANIKNSIENLRQFIISLDIKDTKVGQIKYKVEDDILNFIVSPKDGFFTEDDIASRSSGFKYDLIITLDSPDLESLGKIYDNDTEFFYQTSIINIDHHAENEEFGQINFVELNAISTSEILFSLFESYSRDLIDENIATCLLAGMISKTRSFKTPNITPRSLSAAAQLVAMGAEREKIVNHLYRSRPINALKLWGRVLAKMSSDLGNKLIWSSLSKVDFVKTDSSEFDLNDVVDELIINVPQAKVIVLIYEKEEDGKQSTKALIYSGKNINSLDLVKIFNPTGTKDVAEIKLAKSREEAEKEIIGHIKGRLEKLPL